MVSSSVPGASPVSPPNRLATEKSPYLRQHQHNPVQWFPWGDAAFAKARAEQKPIFLSIGYSTCHWCHVMAHESFESDAIAAQLNADYVCVKVDREERPDVDRLYMTYVQAATGHGGWPMSVWLTPEMKPFFGGTYFPPEDRWGRPGFPTILQRIADAWKTNRESIEQEGENVIASLREHGAGPRGAAAAAEDLGWEPLENCFGQLRQSFDERWGGFGGAPKFPRPVNFNFLFRVVARRDEERPGELTPVGAEALRMTELTLRRMAEGGMRDHLGGGFHRYSVDGEWCVPHFEKMLYDQALLAVSFLEAKQATGREIFAWIARETLAYVQRDLAAPAGGFFSAEDADSARAHDPAEHGEGAFYVWAKSELERLAGADAVLALTHYGAKDEGNAPAGADPQGELQGYNILHQRQPLARTAQLCGLSVEEAEQKLLALNARLVAARAQRPRPHRDEKILTAWNGLMISAFARSVQIDPDSGLGALAAAERTAEFLHRELCDAATGRLTRSWCEGRSAIPGFAEDYAYLVAGLLDLYEAGGAIRWLKWAAELQATMDALFWDDAGGGYFGSPAGDASILVRLKEDYDGAEPSPNSVAALNCLRLGAMLARDDWRRRGEATIQAFRARWEQAPHALPQMLVAIDFALGPVRQVVLAGDRNSPTMRELTRALHARVEAPRVILWADGGDGQAWLGERAAFFRGVKPLDGRATAYVCRNFTCQLPTTDVVELARQLG